MRGKISYKFFEEKFFDLIQTTKQFRRTYKGLFIYAVDGQEVVLPISQSLLDKGYRGRARTKNKETYYPRMYLAQTFDVVNQVTVGVTFSATRNENRDALELIKKLEKNSLSIYDRAFICKALLDAHFINGNYFIFRCQRGATFKEIVDFYKSPRKKEIWKYKGQCVRLLKIKNPQTREYLVVATNLPEKLFSLKQLGELYSRRWLIETSFHDSVNLALDQWHSKSENGILQELFTHLWLINWTRLQVLCENQKKPRWLQRKYKKPNLKLLVSVMIENIPMILANKLEEVLSRIRDFIRRTLQTREYLSRSYPRTKKNSLKSNYPLNNVVRRRKRS